MLAELPAEELAYLQPSLRLVEMPLGLIVFAPAETIEHVFFPISGIVSLLYVMKNGASAEIAMTGYDGLVGVALFMGGETTPNRAVVQSAGMAYRMPARMLKEAFARGGAFHDVLLRYSHALTTQISQTAVCNRHHKVTQQLCRWLLLSLDRLSGMDLYMTQELMANMLGVRREGVTEAAMLLQKEGLIEYHRGHIRVLDRSGLESRVCECYSVVRRETDRLFP